MKRKPARSPHDSLRVVALFCIFVAVLIIISLTYRFVMLLRDSKFDGEHRFTVAVMYGDKTADILSFEPQSKALSSVQLQSNIKISQIEKALGIPIDGYIYDEEEGSDENDIAKKLLLHLYRIRGERKNITSIDIIRLSMYANTIPKKDIVSVDTSYPVDAPALDETLLQLYYDKSIVVEDLEIEIVNAAGVSGLGGRVEKLLTNMGARVISVTTSPTTRVASEIHYFGNNSYTVERLGKVLKFPVYQKENKTVSDIIIILGKDSSLSQVF